MSFLSPYFWIAVLMYGAIAAAGGAKFMSHWDQGTIQKMKASDALAAKARSDRSAANALAALALTKNTERQVQELQGKLATAQANVKVARAKLKEKTSVFITPQADAHVIVPLGFVELWNDAGAAAGGVGGDPGAASPATGTADQPSGVALSTVGVAVEDAAGALAECRGQVSGWQEFWQTVVVPWYGQFVKGLK